MSETDALKVRYTELTDEPYLREWFTDTSILRWYPMLEPMEIEDTVQRWVAFSRYRCSLTAEYQGVPCGLATLYLMPYIKLAHQCQFGMIVSKEFRAKGVGTVLLNNLIHLAKNYFNIELLHLEVYTGNPAIHLYERFGFKEFGRQEKWIKEPSGEFVGRIFMEREL